jgi:protein ImuB
VTGPLALPGRQIVVWCPDWPMRAAGVGGDVPAAIVSANRVRATTAAARDEGVVLGLRRREAQSRCPGLLLVDDDPGRDARAFEPVAAALEQITPAVAVTRPGAATFPVRAASRWAGGERRLVETVVRTAGSAIPGDDPLGVCVGVAEGVVAATLAARQAPPASHRVVDPGTTPAFLAPLPVTCLADHGVPAALVDLFVRLGLVTLGAVAELPAASVLGRFGPDGSRAHRLSRGLDAEPAVARDRHWLAAVVGELDPPVDRVDRAAFAAKTLSDELGVELTTRGMACSAVVVGAETASGERWGRTWRQDGPMDPETMTERVRWQLEGWLRASPSRRPDGPLVRIWLDPVELGPDRGRQVGFWGASAGADERLTRAVARLESILGRGAVSVPELGGGRGPVERVRRVAATGVILGAGRDLHDPDRDEAPWPGRLPAPSPAVVHDPPRPVRLLGEDGAEVTVDGRGLLTAAPSLLVDASSREARVRSWAGPWLEEGRWWDRTGRGRGARLQILTEEGAAHLLRRSGQRWWREGDY